MAETIQGIPAVPVTPGPRPPGRPAELSGWGRHPVIAGTQAWPATLPETGSWLRGPYLPRGLGRSYGDAGLPANGHLAVNGTCLDRFISFDPETRILEAEAGVSLERIIKVFLPKGYFLPVTPGTASVTLGGALASNVHGKNHHQCGSIENFVEEMEVATPAGTILCSPTVRPELFRATLGGYGLTGFITKARLRLKRVHSSKVDCMRVRAKNLDGLFRLFKEHDAGWEYSVAWLDSLAKGASLGRGILMLGDHVKEGPDNKGFAARDFRRAAFKVPFPMPGFLLHPALLKAFNAAFFRVGGNSDPSPEGFASFFYPLDRLRDWNLLYGPAGFLQYQCVIPYPGEDGIAACLSLLSESKVGAFLSVLKRCGNDHVALPFCRKGYTLALDIPYRGEETLKVLERLDQVVLRHKGRVYLTKDARLSRESFRAMYPEWTEWMAEVRRWNPNGLSRSRMAERLGLWQA